MKRKSFISLLGMVFIMTLVLAISAYGADRLVVKDSSGVNTKFVARDDGSITLNSGTPANWTWVKLNAVNEGTNCSYAFDSYSNVPAGGGGLFRRARGTEASPQSVQNDDRFGFFIFSAYDGNQFQNVAGINAYANGSVSQGYVPTRLSFEVGSSTFRPERMVITSNGNVGIGTQNPVGTLDVNGPIYQRGYLRHADYVFSSDYKLETIEEHAKYMWENKHLKALPGVTKDENGLEIVEVGAYQRGILEELEKAHIYIEQLHKRLQDLESKLEVLENTK